MSKEKFAARSLTRLACLWLPIPWGPMPVPLHVQTCVHHGMHPLLSTMR